MRQACKGGQSQGSKEREQLALDNLTKKSRHEGKGKIKSLLSIVLAKPSTGSGRPRNQLLLSQPAFTPVPARPSSLLPSLQPVQEPHWLPVLKGGGGQVMLSCCSVSVPELGIPSASPSPLPLQRRGLGSQSSKWNAEHIFPETQCHTCHLVSVRSIVQPHQLLNGLL